MCDYGLYFGASSDNAKTIAAHGSEAAALKMYLNDTFSALQLESTESWMKVR